MTSIKPKGFNEILGEKIKTLRLINGLSQDQVRKALGYSSSGSLSRIENGEIGMANENIYKAAELFDIHPAFLFSPKEMSEKQLKMCTNLMKLFEIEDSPHLPVVESLLELATK